MNCKRMRKHLTDIDNQASKHVTNTEEQQGQHRRTRTWIDAPNNKTPATPHLNAAPHDKNLVTLKLYPETCRRNFALETMEDVSKNPDSHVVIWRAGGIGDRFQVTFSLFTHE